eukprot:TRINITY_DN16104_c0_g1_i1.p1 TRINITY_DN16104_c0_g1~~TRINITY_DN16104_c0_g1_i1.p1  ORF type:complete len:148 (+),score=21.30 TRINITY_DN16104_c0_g1_i1:194-637(+)
MTLQIWDTAGQERFRNVTQAYYRGAMGIFIVYDITDRKSFERIDTWVDHVSRHASNDVTRMLLGNKCDLAEKERKVSTEEGEAAAEKHGIPFLETSAKENVNINEAFNKLAVTIKSANRNAPARPRPSTIELEKRNPSASEGGGCCS